MEVIYLVAYDIADDRRREEVAAILSSYGARVQLSVFECELADPATVATVTGLLKRAIEPAEDQIRLYPLPAGSVRGTEIIGNRRLEERADFWIV